MTYEEFVKNEDLNGYSTQGASIQATEIENGKVFFDIYSGGRMDGESCIYKMSCAYDTESGNITVLPSNEEGTTEFNIEEVIPPKGTTGLETVYSTDSSEDIHNFAKIMDNITDRLENGKIEYSSRYDSAEVTADKVKQEIVKPEISYGQLEDLVSTIKNVSDSLENVLDRFDESNTDITDKLREIFGEIHEITPITVSGWMEGIVPHFEIQLDGIKCYDSEKDDIQELMDAYEKYDYNKNDFEIGDEELVELKPENDYYGEDISVIINPELSEVISSFGNEEIIYDNVSEENEEFNEKTDNSGKISESCFVDGKVSDFFPNGSMQTVRSGFIPVEYRIGNEKALLTNELVQEIRNNVSDFGRFMGFDTTDKSFGKTYLVPNRDFSKVCESLFNQNEGKFEIGSFGAYSDKGLFSAGINDIKEMSLYVDSRSTGGVWQRPVDANGKPIKGNVEKLSDAEICYKIYDPKGTEIVTLADIKDGLYADKGYSAGIDENGKVEVFYNTRINTVKIDGVRVETYSLCTIEIKDKENHVFRDTCLIDARGGVISSDLFEVTSGLENKLLVKADASIPVLNQFDTKENSYRSLDKWTKEGQNLESIQEKYEVKEEGRNITRAASILSGEMKGRMGRIDSLIEEKSFERNNLEKKANFKELAREICATSLSEKLTDTAKLISDIDKGKETESPEKIDSMKSELMEKLDSYHKEYQTVRPGESAIISSQVIGTVQGVRVEIENLQETKSSYDNYLKEFKENSPRENLARISKIESSSVDRCTTSLELDAQYVSVTPGELEIVEQVVEEFNKDLPEEEKVTVEKDGIYTREGCSVTASNPNLTLPVYHSEYDRQTKNLYSKEYDKVGISEDFDKKSKEIQSGDTKTPLEKSHFAGVSMVSENIMEGIMSPIDIIPRIIDANCYDESLKNELLKINEMIIESSGVDYIEDRSMEESDSVEDEKRDSDKKSQNVERIDSVGKIARGLTGNGSPTLDKYLKAFSGPYTRLDVEKDVELSDKAKKEIDERAEKEAKDPITGKVDEAKREELKEKYTNEKLEELESIKSRIITGINNQEKHIESVPRKAQHGDTFLTIDNFNIDRAAYDYIKAGGKYGNGCFIENGVTSTHLFSDLVSIQQSNLLISIEWRIIDAVAEGIEKMLFGEPIGRDQPYDKDAVEKKGKEENVESQVSEEAFGKDSPEDVIISEENTPEDVSSPEKDFPKEEITSEEKIPEEVSTPEGDDTEKISVPEEDASEEISVQEAQDQEDVTDENNPEETDITVEETPEEVSSSEEDTPENISEEEQELKNDKTDAAVMDDFEPTELDEISSEDSSDIEKNMDEDEEDGENEDKTESKEKETEKEEIEPDQQEELENNTDKTDWTDNVDTTGNEMEKNSSEAEESPVLSEETPAEQYPQSSNDEVQQENIEDKSEDNMYDTDSMNSLENSMNGLETSDPDNELFNYEMEDEKENLDVSNDMDLSEVNNMEPVATLDGQEFYESDMDYVLNGGTLDTDTPQEIGIEEQQQLSQEFGDTANDSLQMMEKEIDSMPNPNDIESIPNPNDIESLPVDDSGIESIEIDGNVPAVENFTSSELLDAVVEEAAVTLLL